LDRYVAVKKLKLVTDEEARERFKLEAKTLAKMSHPNIPAIYDIDISSDEMLIYFEYLEGNNLRKIINQKTIPTIEDVRRWFTHIASALQHAHDMGVIHRDVKPENIIFSRLNFLRSAKRGFAPSGKL
jgi:serine/threonine-protein kinase